MLKMIEQSIASSWYIYICMLGVILMGGYFIYKLTKYQKDFESAAFKIKRTDEYVEHLRAYLDGTTDEQEHLFQTENLQNIFAEYRDTYRKTLKTKGAAPFVDISDFYNSDYLDEIGSTGICDLISGTMTGLGILGTFLGLVLGISGFDTTTTDAITSSISGLLGGMGTAFFTSIVGVLLSLLFSYVHKIVYNRTNKGLEDFVTAFHDNNLDGSSNNAENQLLGYQQQQTELMKNFATVVSEAVSTSIANTMRTELVPIFDEMKSTVKEFSEIASQQQKDGLNQVVQEFIRCMNESLRGQFDELAATIQKTCEWQKASTEQMQKIVDGICDTSNEIEKVNAVSHQTVEEMNGFVTLLKEYQEKLHSEAELIQQQIANSNEISERQANYLDKLVESESRVADLADSVKKEAEAAQQAVDMLSDHCKDQISGIVDAAKQDMDALAASTKVLTEASHSQMETLAQTAESEMQLLSNTAAQLSEENHKQLMELTKASSEQMSVISEAANNVMQNSKQQIEEAIKATQAQSDALMQATNDLSDFVQQEHKKLVEAVDKEMSGLSNFAGQTTSEIQSATAGMENAARLLDKNLDDVLDCTFTSFDSSLTDISQHLSGTIADVRDTTEALPHVIRESQKQYEAVLAKLTSQTQTYLDAMEKLTALVEQKAPAVADEEGNRQ